MAGEFEGGANLGYTSTNSSSNSAGNQILTSGNPTYKYSYATTTTAASNAHGWTLSTASYTCAVGVDAYF